MAKKTQLFHQTQLLKSHFRSLHSRRGGRHGSLPSSSQHVQPWEPTCVLANFPHAVSCGDSWSHSANLVIGTEQDGTFLVASNRPPVS